MTFQPGDIVKHKCFPGTVAVVVALSTGSAGSTYSTIVCINWVLPPAAPAAVYFRQDHPDYDYMANSCNLTLIQKGESK